MYVVYVSKSINVSTLAGIWGQDHNTVHNGVLQSIHILLKQHPDWAKAIRATDIPRNARVVHLNQAIHEDLVTIEFTGLMEDAGFQVIASIDDADVEAVYTEFKKAQKEHSAKLVEFISADAEAQIEKHGVCDRSSMQAGKLQFTFSNTTATNAARKHLDSKKAFIQEHVTNAIPTLGDAVRFLEA